MKRGLYANRPNLTIGFHGCDQSVVDKVIAGKENLLMIMTGLAVAFTSGKTTRKGLWSGPRCCPNDQAQASRLLP